MPNLPVAAISAALGLCGVLYELALAQTLSILLGQSIVQYSVTIGLFLAGMGLGARWSDSCSSPRLSLWRLQLALAGLAPILFVFIWWLSLSGFMGLTIFFAYSTCFAVGALTGGELPLIMRLSRRPIVALAADYFGMLGACLLFPLLLLPMVGVFATFLFAALVNAAVMLGLGGGRGRWPYAVPALLILALVGEPILRDWLSARLMAG